MKFKRHLFRGITISAVLFSIGLSAALGAAGYEVDPAGSSLTFVAPSRLGDVEGKFHKWKFEGTIDEAFKVKGKIVVEVASIDTNNRRRDDHLRNEDFFHVEKYPTAVFVVDSVSGSEDEYNVKGTLTMHGVTKPIDFTLVRDGLVLKGGVVLNRTDFGMTYQSVLNPIEDQIPLRIRLQLKKK